MDKNKARKKIEAVIFDLGRVLIQVDLTKGLFPFINNNPGKDDQIVLTEVFKNPLFVAFCTGQIDSFTLYNEMHRMFSLDMSFERFSHVWCDVFSPMEEMEEIVDTISKEYKIGLLSDTDPLHWEFVLKKYPFLKRFSNPTLSFEIGVLKPAKTCYQRAAEDANTAVESCLFIDDRIENVEGAKNAGMHAIQFISPQKLQSDLISLNVLKPGG